MLANFQPGHQDDLGRLPQRRPGAAAVHLRQRGPPHAAGIQQSNAKHYKSDTVTEVKEYQGRTCCRPQGWEEVADYALDWALEHAGAGRATLTAVAHHPHRRADRADRGRRLAAAHRPHLRPPRPALRLRLGHVVAQAHRPGHPGRGPRRRSTPSCSPTTTTATTSTPPAGRCCRRPARWSPPPPGARRLGGGARGLRPWAAPARGPRPADDRDHRDALPARPAAEPADRRRRHRLRAALGGPGARRALDLRRHRPLRRRPRGRPSGSRSAPRCCTSAASASRHRAAALHDDRPRGGRACGIVRPHTAIPSTTRAGSTSRRAARRSNASSRGRRRTSARRIRWLPIGNAGRRVAVGQADELGSRGDPEFHEHVS